MIEHLAEVYDRSQRTPRRWGPSVAVFVGLTGGLALFVAIFHDAPARIARDHIAAERMIGANW